MIISLTRTDNIFELKTGDVRAVPSLLVEHDPLPENRSHAAVYGEKDTEVRVKLGRIAARAGNTLTLERPLRLDYQAVFNPEIRKITPVTEI
ncbi:MAG: hypothetical protein WCS70_15880 [Verrucomicrobiota bacterium]